MRVQLQYFQAHIHSSSSTATWLQRKACEQSQVSADLAQLFQGEYGNMNTCNLVCCLYFLLLCLYFRPAQSRDPMLFLLNFSISERRKIWHCVNPRFISRLKWWWLFLQEKEKYIQANKIHQCAFDAWSRLGSLTSMQTNSAIEFQRVTLQARAWQQPFFFSLCLHSGKSYTHHWKLWSRQRSFIT